MKASDWNFIQGTPAAILERIVREGDPQPPLHYWLLWGWSRLNGDSEFALRFPSVFFSTLLVPLMYQVGRKLWRKEAGLVAALVTSSSTAANLAGTGCAQHVRPGTGRGAGDAVVVTFSATAWRPQELAGVRGLRTPRHVQPLLRRLRAARLKALTSSKPGPPLDRRSAGSPQA